MNKSSLGFFALSSLFVLSVAAFPVSVYAQCGCTGAAYAPMAPMYAPAPIAYSAPIVHAAPMTYAAPRVSYPLSRGPSSIAYVNKLSTPISRGTHTLSYAIHLTDGRILLSSFLPAGYTVQGTEFQSGGRKVIATRGGAGVVTVLDPASNQTIATFNRF